MKPAALILADLLEQAGVETVVCSPGSRNAPLIAALEEKPLKLLDIIDERAAAFVALGIARQSRKRVAMVCTSGTALLNYAPAVAEAFYQGVPLVVVSADRPMQWIDQDDSQTIRQAGALGNIVKGSFDIPDFPGSDAEMCWYASRTVNEALLLAVSPKPGPVHLNFQFNEPLRSEASLEAAPRQVSLLSGKSSIPVTVGRELAKHLQDKRILLVAGFLPPDHKLSSILRRFITLPNVFLLPEVLSNLHSPPYGGIDRCIAGLKSETLKALLPDVVITIGGALVSRKVKEWLRSAPASMEHWALDTASTLADCFRHLSLKITVSPAYFFSRLGRELAVLKPITDYKHKWTEVMSRTSLSASAFLSKAPWSDLAAHNILYSLIPHEWNVCCSNGTSIRYAELFCSPHQQQLSCNRGTSGIEGCTSTAVGQALATPETTLLVTGDMSLRPDLAGLALPCVPDTFKAVVFNNNGGDIFRFIPSTRDIPALEQHFTLSGQVQTPLKQIAEALGFVYLKADSAATLNSQLSTLNSSPKKTILEVFTPAEANASVLRTFLSRKS